MKLELDTDRMIAEIKDGIGWVIYNNPNASTPSRWR